MNQKPFFVRLREEVPRMIRFIVVGLLSLGLVMGLYGLLSRIVWPSGSRSIQYAMVSVFVTWLNYEANRHFTFQNGARSIGSVGRFATVAVLATVLNNLFFWIGHNVLHLLDFSVILINTAVIAGFTFTSHRFFTFHERPYRHFSFLKRRI